MMKKVHGPQSIRVRQVYRSELYKDNREEFLDILGSKFIPKTVQMMEPVGLRSYFPAILPESNFILPDAIALVSYASQEDYYKAMETIDLGKTYRTMYDEFFNVESSATVPRSKSAFPVSYKQNIVLGQPYYLCDNEIDWRDNKTTVYCARRALNTSKEEMLNHIEKTIPAWLKKNNNVNGSILVCEENFVLYWEHSTYLNSGEQITSLFPLLSPVLDRPIISDKPLLRSVPTLHSWGFDGLKVTSGSNLDVRLIERSLHRRLPSVRIKLDQYTS